MLARLLYACSVERPENKFSSIEAVGISDFLEATRRDRWERGIYSAAAVHCQRSGGMNSALPKNLRCDHIEAVGFPSMILCSFKFKIIRCKNWRGRLRSTREDN